MIIGFCMNDFIVGSIDRFCHHRFLFLSDFIDNGIEAYPVDPGADSGFTPKRVNGFPQLKNNILKGIPLIFTPGEVHPADAPDGTPVAIDELNELMLFQTPFKWMSLMY